MERISEVVRYSLADRMSKGISASKVMNKMIHGTKPSAYSASM
jgi:hypothetical protein